MPTLFPLQRGGVEQPPTPQERGVRDQRGAHTPWSGPTTKLTPQERRVDIHTLKAMQELQPDRATARQDFPSSEVKGVRMAPVRSVRRDHLGACLKADDRTFNQTLKVATRLDQALKAIGR